MLRTNPNRLTPDKLIILGLLLVFLSGFFVLFIKYPGHPDSGLFQYLFFITSLTMAFTGFFGATGTFKTKGQTLGGGAAIFVVMVVALAALKPVFSQDNFKNEIIKLAGTKIKLEEAMVSITKEINACRQNSPDQNLTLVIRQGRKIFRGDTYVVEVDSDASDRVLTITNDGGRYPIRLDYLGQGGYIYIRNEFGKVSFDELCFKYIHQKPLLELILSETNNGG